MKSCAVIEFYNKVQILILIIVLKRKKNIRLLCEEKRTAGFDIYIPFKSILKCKKLYFNNSRHCFNHSFRGPKLVSFKNKKNIN